MYCKWLGIQKVQRRKGNVPPIAGIIIIIHAKLTPPVAWSPLAFNTCPVELEQAANVTILTQVDCQSRFKKYKIYDGMICAGGETGEKATDACQVIKFTKTITSKKIFRKFLTETLMTIDFLYL